MNDIIGRSSSLSSPDGPWGVEEAGLKFGPPVEGGTPAPLVPPDTSPLVAAASTETAGVQVLPPIPAAGVCPLPSRGRNSQRCRGKSSTKSLGLRVS